MTTEHTTIKLKILDIEEFKCLVDALAQWADEVSKKEAMTDKERALFDAAVDAAKLA